MKNEIRKYAKEYRKTLNCEYLSEKIHENLFKLDEWKYSQNIFCYYSFKNEVNTTKLLLIKDKNWYLPRIQEDTLLVCKYDKNKLVCNKYGIKEPLTKSENVKTDLIIVPALAADRQGYRIGYGGGYYDRFFKSLDYDPVKIILLYSDLLYDSVYPETFDVKCDIIVTDKEIYKTNC